MLPSTAISEEVPTKSHKCQEVRGLSGVGGRRKTCLVEACVFAKTATIPISGRLGGINYAFSESVVLRVFTDTYTTADIPIDIGVKAISTVQKA